ncbi:Kelch repeat-containing protein [Steroidobacter cummioxidans]|uniref:Kelch repeat-containing protein n=1 Tax=Steroidobacter cummioxidans TaxID=1803913 RepID=UPI000E318998|nr:kelch repeat-containing protein [Steroidobacter cummioxidans]
MMMRYVGLAACLLLGACGGGGGGGSGGGTPPPTGSEPPPSTSASVSGAVQKGPFLVGSTVLVNKLDTQGRPTDSTTVTEIADSIGSFSFRSTGTGPVQIIASGYYFNELTGNVSGGTLTLKALYDVGSASTQTAYVNILTHLINNRVLHLMSGSQLTLSNAIAQAEREFIDAFSPALPVSSLGSFSALSVYNVTGTSEVGNAYLLALSTGFYKYAALRSEEFGTAVEAELTLILNQIADDLRDDGVVQRAGFIDDFTDAIRSLSPTEIAANLRRRSIADYPSGLDVPNISRFLNQCAGSAECAWSNGAPMPAPSRGHAAVRFGNKMYVFGGVTAADGSGDPTAYSWTRMYDPVANSWVAKTPMPVGGYDVKAHLVGDKIYVLPAYGVNGFRNEVLEYDPVNDSWAVKTPSPTYRYTFSSQVVNGKIYLIAGEGTLNDGPWAPGAEWAFKDHVAIYDPATDTWSAGPPSPTTFASAGTCALDDNIYIFGGRSSSNAALATTWVYNVSTETWSAKSPLAATRQDAKCVRVGDLFYVLGGSNSGGPLESVERYDPATDSWTSPTRIPTPRYFIEAEAIGSKIFIPGGRSWTGDLLDALEILDTAI